LIALLLLSESRGGFLAAFVGLLIVGAVLGIRRQGRGAMAAAAALLLLVGLAGAFQAGLQLSKERMETAGFRLDLWRSGLRMLRAHPVLGWGAGSFAAEYPPYRSEAEFRYSHKHAANAFKEVEDAHSSWVQTAVETGAAGVLALLLVAYVAARLWRYYVAHAPDEERLAPLAGLGGGAAAYLVAGLFNTLTLKTSATLLFWIFLGLLGVLGDPRPWRRSGRAGEGKVAVPAAAAIIALFGALWTANTGLAEAAFQEGMRASDATVREARMRESLDKNPYSTQSHYQLALALSSQGRFNGAAEEAREALRLHPYRVEVLNHAGICVLQSGGDAAEAEALFRRATEIAPFYFKSWHNLGVLELRRGRRDEARRLFSRAIELNPNHASGYVNRGILNVLGGEGEAALEDLRRARALGVDVAGALRSEVPSAQSDSRYAEFFR
jgi:Flp pilus assembly protein TadD